MYSSLQFSSLCVGLECGGEVDVRLVLSYVVSNASWSSAYDVRVFAKNKAMKVCHTTDKLCILYMYTLPPGAVLWLDPAVDG